MICVRCLSDKCVFKSNLKLQLLGAMELEKETRVGANSYVLPWGAMVDY